MVTCGYFPASTVPEVYFALFRTLLALREDGVDSHISARRIGAGENVLRRKVIWDPYKPFSYEGQNLKCIFIFG